MHPEGLNLSEISRIARRDRRTIRPRLKKMIDAGHIALEGRKYCLTNEGWLEQARRAGKVFANLSPEAAQALMAVGDREDIYPEEVGETPI